ncbi:NAD(P)/FAD-dependent oxidoreductase [Pseudahrensia aquimaris]|uniref:NAD(P)/FAD-dependent oxidoreductase n=1 Tax=Pseudahrensia aquimaris TaxID=744461 RepID=A0ABW3FM27_9HYPH
MKCVIVGGGQAASSAAAKLRELDSDAEITMICGEPVLPYQRPPLSKKYLSGEMPLDRLVLRPQEWFDDQRVDVVTGVLAESIDRGAKTIICSDGSAYIYDKLLLATGSSVRRLPASIGGGRSRVHYLRSTNDADHLAPYLKEGGRMVMVGGGYIGLEVAAVARSAGMEVSVVEMAPRILQRVAAPETSDFFRSLHTGHGVRLLEGVGLERLEEAGEGITAHLSDSTSIEADVAVVGIGIVPDVDLADHAGLTLDNGIAVDDYCTTDDDDIFAAGDCASFIFKNSRIRLESVPNAIHQAEIAARNMLGERVAYLATPWFWSDQYDVKLQIAGLNMGYDETVVRPGKREGAQSVWYFRDGEVLAVDAMNDAPAFMMARRILEGGKSITPAQAADPQSDLKAIAL